MWSVRGARRVTPSGLVRPSGDSRDIPIVAVMTYTSAVRESPHRKGTAMHLTKLDGCQGNSCPAIYATDRGTLVVQGDLVTDPQALVDANPSAGETLVEIPRELLASLTVQS
jgi:hypothetical protein